MNKQHACLAQKKNVLNEIIGVISCQIGIQLFIYSKDFVVISQVALLSVLPYSTEISMTSLYCVFCVVYIK